MNNNVSPIMASMIKDYNNGVSKQKPANETPLSNKNELKQDTFIKRNKKVIIGSAIGAVTFVAGFILLAKSGKIGNKCQEFVNQFSSEKTGLNLKGKTFIDANGKKIKKLELKDGVFCDKQGNAFNGVMKFTNGSKEAVENVYENGKLSTVNKNGKLFRQYEYTSDGKFKNFINFDENGERIYAFEKKSPNYHFATDFETGITKHTIKNDDFVQLSEIKDKDVLNFKHYDKKLGKYTFEGKTQELERFNGINRIEPQKFLVVNDLENPNIKLLFSKKLEGGTSLRLPSGANEGYTGSAIPLIIEESLPNGLTKFCGLPPKSGATASGYILPNGNVLSLQNYGEKSTRKIGIIHPIKRIDEEIVIHDGSYCIRMFESPDYHIVTQKERETLKELYSKFIPSDYAQQFYDMPVKNLAKDGYSISSGFWTKDFLEEFLEKANYNTCPDNPHYNILLKLMEKYGI